jgi:hypothetical protein
MTVGKILEMMSVFKESFLVQLSYSDNNLNFKIRCKPLATLVNEQYQYFYGVFKSCSDSSFEPLSAENERILDINQINDLE